MTDIQNPESLRSNLRARRSMATYDSDCVPQSAMVIFAHPDDAEFVCAGTVAKWASSGCSVTYVVCTSGNVGSQDSSITTQEVARIREEEQRKACDVLGAKNLVFLRFNGCELQPTLELRRKLVGAIRHYKPEVVICDDPNVVFFDDDFLPGGDNINHPDHRAAALATVEAVFPCASMPLLWPEHGEPHSTQALYIRGNTENNVWIDISETIEVKIAALKQHRSQLGDWDPRSLIWEWAVWEGRQRGLELAEAFRVLLV